MFTKSLKSGLSKTKLQTYVNIYTVQKVIKVPQLCFDEINKSRVYSRRRPSSANQISALWPVVPHDSGGILSCQSPAGFISLQSSFPCQCQLTGTNMLPASTSARKAWKWRQREGREVMFSFNPSSTRNFLHLTRDFLSLITQTAVEFSQAKTIPGRERAGVLYSGIIL